MTTSQPTHPDLPEPVTAAEPDTVWRRLPLPDGPYRLGRHVLHDPRSRDWDAADLLPRSAINTVTGAVVLPTQDQVWARHCPPWDQGEVSSCTTNAALGLMMTGPFYATAAARAEVGYWRNVRRTVDGVWQFTEPDCLALYGYETRLDNVEVPGSYPPDDTGSTGLWSMKTLRAYRLIDSYRHAFGLNTALSLLANNGPIAVGSAWYDSMFQPDSNGLISISPDASVVGGHEYQVRAVYPQQQLVQVTNSWGPLWGVGGEAFMTWDTLGRLLDEQGDAVIPTLT